MIIVHKKKIRLTAVSSHILKLTSHDYFEPLSEGTSLTGPSIITWSCEMEEA